jgi:transcriptional antiterminator NusG
MMAVDYKNCVIGDHVGMVDLVTRNADVVDKPTPKRWYMLEVRPGKDSTVMRTFKRHSIDAYSPTIKKTEVFRGRKREVVTPLFPGLIVLPDYEALLDVRAYDGVIGFVRFGEFFLRLRPKDMQDIRNIETNSNVPLSKRDRMFKTGQLVRVVDGPFASFSGHIERLDSKGRLSVLVDIFSRMTPVVLEEGQVEPGIASTGAINGSMVARHKQLRFSRAL